MTDLKYVTNKLNCKIFNIKAIAEVTDVSRATLTRIKNGVKVRDYHIQTLTIFFKNVGL